MKNDHLLFISCRRAQELCSKKLDGELSVKEYFLLCLHLLICSICRAARCQFEAIQQGVQKLYTPLEDSHAETTLPEAKLPDHIKEAIKKKCSVE